MFQLKSLSIKAVPEALQRARHYRLLNEPVEAESICLDVLTVDPENKEAVILLVLSRADQLERGGRAALQRAREALAMVEDGYEREYYAGLLCERQAKTVLRGRGRRVGVVAYEWFRQAMGHYERAIEVQPTGVEDATLRWNTCVRIIERHPHCAPDPTEHIELGLE